MQWLPDAFYASKYQPWLLPEKYGDTFDDEKNRKRTAEKEKDLKYTKDRMMHGKKKVGTSRQSTKYKDFVKKAAESKKKLRPGEVKRWDKAKKKWISNKD